MLLVERVAAAFDFLIGMGFMGSIEKINHVFHKLVYCNETIKILVPVEEMDQYFGFRIEVTKLGHRYIISPHPDGDKELERYRDTRGTIYKSVFDFTDNIDEKEFLAKISTLFPKVQPFVLFGRRKALVELVELHTSLLETALTNIIPWIQKDEEHSPE